MIGVVLDQLPLLAVRSWPTCGVPVIVGRLVLVGGLAVVTVNKGS